MTKNDTLYKVLFAFILAFIPLVMFVNFVKGMPQWTMGLFVLAILVCYVWMQILKNKTNLTHNVISSIGEVAVFVSLIIFYHNLGFVNLSLTIISIILLVIADVLHVSLYKVYMPEMIQTIEVCRVLFVCLTMVSLIIVFINRLMITISLIALCLSSVILIGYKVFYLIKYTNFLSNLKNLFRKK